MVQLLAIFLTFVTVKDWAPDCEPEAEDAPAADVSEAEGFAEDAAEALAVPVIRTSWPTCLARSESLP